MDWTESERAELREFWDSGMKTAAIATRLGATKNAIVGKAHRMGLTPRPSPVLPRRIQIDRHPGRPPAASPAVPTLPPLASAPVVHAPAPTGDPRPPAPARVSTARSCCWPLGDPGTRSFRFCDERAERVYCDEHYKLAHQRVREPA